MKASVGHRYSEYDQRHEYWIEALFNPWLWFGIGQTVPKAMSDSIYPYSLLGGKEWTFESGDSEKLGRKCGKKLLKLFEKYGK